eukprot:TRINITY_DN81963_c0_g1_i1.p4 TRINITY_DN81963_c0_g1~~TRINITY_DN81963_c0_g1_i1.p4  ORF type:complete len:103 (-),score=4.42 TRINITY_DN81963_c0_g1_i1:13-321(-)
MNKIVAKNTQSKNPHIAHGKEENAVKALKDEKETPNNETLLLAIYAVEFTNKKIPLEDKASPIFSKRLASRLVAKQESLYLPLHYKEFTKIPFKNLKGKRGL